MLTNRELREFIVAALEAAEAHSVWVRRGGIGALKDSVAGLFEIDGHGYYFHVIPKAELDDAEVDRD